MDDNETLEDTVPTKSRPVDVDLSAFEEFDEANMVVKHPDTGDPTTWVITFAGPGHQQTVEHTNRTSRKTIAEEREIKMAAARGRNHNPEKVTVDQRRAENLQWIISRIIRWTPVRINGEDFPFTPANAMKLLGDPRKPKLFQQCLDFIIAEKSFMKRSESKLEASPSAVSH